MNPFIFESDAEVTNDDIDAERRRFLTELAALTGVVGLGLPLIPNEAVAATMLARRLETKVDRYIKRLRRAGLVSPDERTAWSIYDFTLQQKLVSINENIPLQSASMIKPFVALAFFYKVRENSRRYRYDRRARAKMEAMIRRSSNSATNYFINLINGPRAVEQTLKRHAPGVFQHTRIVELIPRSGATYRNKASARDYSRFLYAVWHDQFPFSGELKKLMGLPNKDRIYYGADQIPRGTRVYDKTGSTARLCGDMGILVARGKNGRPYPYTFIGIIEKSRRTRSYTSWVASRGDVIREVSNIVYSELKRVHRLI